MDFSIFDRLFPLPHETNDMAAQSVTTSIALPELDSLRGLSAGETTVMRLTTSKNARLGGIVTHMAVGTRAGEFFSTMLYSDASEYVAKKLSKRVTQKAINSMHEAITATDISLYTKIALDHYEREAGHRTD